MTYLKKYQSHIISVLFAFLTYLALLTYFSTSGYNFILMISFFFLIAFYYKCQMLPDKKNKIYAYILSAILSILLGIGQAVYPLVYSGAVSIFNIKILATAIIFIIGAFLFFSRLFSHMFFHIDKVTLFKEDEAPKHTLKFFFAVFGIILLCWLPYFLRFYPAIMTSDSYYVIHNVNSCILTDFHTFGHTWAFGIFFLLGKLIFSSMNAGVGFSILIQMLVMASMFSYAVTYLYKKGLNKWLCAGCTLVYALSPLHALYSVTLWRDICFGGAFILLCISLLKMLSAKERLDKSSIILLVISSLFILFFRNNGIYIYIFLLPFFIFSKMNFKKILLPIYIGILIVYFIIKGPVFDYFHIQKSTTVEAFSIPLQQIARVVASGEELDQESADYLETIMDVKSIPEKYASATADPVKNLTNTEALSNSKIEFFKIWFKNLIKHPKTYIEAYFTETLGYWYPNVEYWASGGESSSFFDDVDVQSHPLVPDGLKHVIDQTSSRNLPFSNLIWSIGTETFILIISTFIFAYKNDKKYLLCYVPLYALLFSILLATPVFCELRYVYGLFTCSPLLLLIPFMKNMKKTQ